MTRLPGIFLLLYLVSLCALPAAAGEVRTLTLDQTLAIAWAQNRSIAKALEFRNQAEGIYVAERAAALPRLTARGTLSREDDDVTGTSIINRQEAWLQLDQTLFTWGQVRAGIRAAEIGLKTADEQLRANRQAALRDAATAFYDILFARELNSVFAADLAQKSRRLHEARKRLGVGVATEYDVLAAEVAEVNARPELVRTENLVRTLRDRLRLILGLGEPVEVTGRLEATLAEPPDYHDALAVAREYRPELRDLVHRIGIAEELITIAGAGDKPRLDLTGSYGWKELESGSSDPDGKNWDLGLNFSWPIFDGLQTRGRVQVARSNRDALRIDELQLLDTVGLQTREAIDKIYVAAELVRALEGSVTQAERLLALSEKGFEYGVKIRLEVDDAELNLRQARTSLALARRDYLVAMVELAWAMGVLGEREIPGVPVAPLASPPSSRQEVTQ